MSANAVGRERKRNRINEIVDHFANLIESGGLKKGDRLPTTIEIQRMFLAHTGIVQEARHELIRQGLIELLNAPGKGIRTFVK